MSDSTLPSVQNDLGGAPIGGPDFSSCPPIFVLSAHLDLEHLVQIEEDLVKRGARLTYDASEARFVIGRIGKKQRAALELRSHGVWTEEVAPPSCPKPPAKRRRAHEPEPSKESVTQSEVIDLSTETEGEQDGMKSQHTPAKHLKRLRSVSPEGLSIASTDSITSAASLSDEQTDVITVIKLEWLTMSLETQKLAPIDSFVVYRGRKIERPTVGTSVGKTPTSSEILQRAKQDAMFKPPAATPPGRFTAYRSKEAHERVSSQHAPPKLYRQTTSEHDETVPLPPVPDWVKNGVMYACMRSAPLHPPNEEFIAQLLKIRKVRELTLDEIGVRAYNTSIAAIAAYPYKLKRPAEVLTLPGCESKIANLFAEFKQSEDGTLTDANALDTDPVLRILHLFWNIWGVGPKTARDFYYTRQWRDLDDVVEHGWDSLSRVQQIGVKYYDEFLAGVPRSESEEIARIIRRHANLVRPQSSYDERGVECIIVGGYRRGKEVSGDVDLILSHRDEAVTKDLVVDVVRSLETEGWITHTLALHMTASHRDQQTVPYRADGAGQHHFDTLDKALVVWQNPHFEDDHPNPDPSQTDPEEKQQLRSKRNPNPHRRVDIIISPWRTVGCAVLGWSGDTTFERDLRRYAKKAHGWKFDSSGVRERTSGGHVIDLEAGGNTWEERERLVMEGLGVGWRPPEERCTR